MRMTADDSSVMEKTKDLCAAIVEHPDFRLLQEKVEVFLGDESARLQFQSVQERGQDLHQKQHAGMELSEAEIRDWEAAREELTNNRVVRSFLQARQELEGVQKMIGSYVGMTMELGRVAEPEDFAAEEGGCCCGGGGCCDEEGEKEGCCSDEDGCGCREGKEDAEKEGCCSHGGGAHEH